MKIQNRWLGCLPIEKSYEIQDEVAELTRKPPYAMTVLGMEHPLIVTLGIRGEPAKDLAAELPYIKIRRGGQATVHNEGQLVIYPVLNLRQLNLRPKRYVQLLLETTKELLYNCGLEAEEGSSPGLYVDGGKIASLGIQIERGVSKHGVALNVCNDLAPFKKIVCCGVKNQKVVSLKTLGVSASVQDLFEQWIQLFNRHLCPSSSLTPNLKPTTLNSSKSDLSCGHSSVG